MQRKYTLYCPIHGNKLDVPRNWDRCENQYRTPDYRIQFHFPCKTESGTHLVEIVDQRRTLNPRRGERLIPSITLDFHREERERGDD